MEIDGVDSSDGDGYVVLCVRQFSDALKDLIRSELSTICHGAKSADSGLELYLYEATVCEFWRRYEQKSHSTKVGIIGELLAHILASKYLEGYRSASILFNPSERSIKKGFDLNFVGGNQIWYGEVKSGEGDETIDDKNKTLLNRSKSGLVNYFENADTIQSKWLAASNEAAIIFADDEAHKIKEMLSKDYFQNRIANSPATANVVLISVPFHDTNSGVIDHEKVNEYRQGLVSDGTFGGCVILSIQKSTIDTIENFLREEALRHERASV